MCIEIARRALQFTRRNFEGDCLDTKVADSQVLRSTHVVSLETLLMLKEFVLESVVCKQKVESTAGLHEDSETDVMCWIAIQHRVVQAHRMMYRREFWVHVPTSLWQNLQFRLTTPLRCLYGHSRSSQKQKAWIPHNCWQRPCMLLNLLLRFFNLVICWLALVEGTSVQENRGLRSFQNC